MNLEQKGRLTYQHILIGMPGSGKTYKTMSFLSKYAATRLCIFIHNGEPKLESLPTFDITNPQNIPKAGMYAININSIGDVLLEVNVSVHSKEGIKTEKRKKKADIFTFIRHHIRDAHVVFDDALAYMSSHLPESLVTITTNRRQYSIDLWFNFQSINAVPPKLYYHTTHIWQFLDTSKPKQSKEKTPEWALNLLTAYQPVIAKFYDKDKLIFPYIIWNAQKATDGKYPIPPPKNMVWSKDKSCFIIKSTK